MVSRCERFLGDNEILYEIVFITYCFIDGIAFQEKLFATGILPRRLRGLPPVGFRHGRKSGGF